MLRQKILFSNTEEQFDFARKIILATHRFLEDPLVPARDYYHNHIFKKVFFYHATNLPHIKQLKKNKKYNKAHQQDPKLIKNHLWLLVSPVYIKGKRRDISY